MATPFDLIKAYHRGEIQGPGVAKLMEMRVTEVEEGRVTMQMPVDERYSNMIGTVHGGVICDLADAAMGSAFATTCREGETYATVELKCNFLRPVWKSMLTAKAWVVSRGKTMGMSECEVRDDQNKLIAKLSCTLTVLLGDAAKGRSLR